MNRKMVNSGIEWIGEIPESWRCERLNTYINSINNGSWGVEFKNNTDDINVVRILDFDRRRSTIKNNVLIKRNISKNSQKLINFNSDILIEKSGGGDKTPVGANVMFKEHINATYTNFISKITLDTSRVNISYYNYILSVIYDIGIVRKYINQTTGIQNLNLKAYLYEYAAFPSINEQEKISIVLDKKTYDIDNIVKQTKESIDELVKYKQSIITEAVTKGLNPNVETKNSEIEWISKTPNHWSTRKINNYFFQVKNKNDTLEEANLLSLSYGTIVKRDIKSTSGLLPDNFKSYNIIQKGDIILRMTDLQNDKVSLRTAYSEENGIITSAYITIRTKLDNLIYSKYIQYFLHSFDINKGFYGMGNGVRQNVTYNDIKKIEILVPPLSEQHEIIMFLDTKTRLIDKLIEDKTKLIEELENYRKSVIYEYVTGKKEA